MCSLFCSGVGVLLLAAGGGVVVQAGRVQGHWVRSFRGRDELDGLQRRRVRALVRRAARHQRGAFDGRAHHRHHARPAAQDVRAELEVGSALGARLPRGIPNELALAFTSSSSCS